MDSFQNKFETDTIEIAVAGRAFHILLPRYLQEFINPQDVLHDFPLWAKLWQASWVLAAHLAERPAEAGKVFLEVGGGVGLVSIVAHTFGHRITMSEYNADALAFARANAQLNGCGDLSIVELDWNNPTLKGNFDVIVASEVAYRQENFKPLVNLFQRYLKPQGQIILAAEMRKTSGEFYRYLQPWFDIQMGKKIVRSENEKSLVTLSQLTLRTNPGKH